MMQLRRIITDHLHTLLGAIQFIYSHTQRCKKFTLWELRLYEYWNKHKMSLT